MKAGWEIKTLKDICEKITDGTHQTPTYHDEGIIFLSSRNVTSGKIDWDNIKYIDTKQHLDLHKRLAPRMNDILLAKNGTTGVAAIVDKDVVFDIYVSLALLRPLDEILPDFLLHFINSPLAKEQFNKRLKGAGVPNLHLQEIREVQIPLPPLPEQKRLVTLLDEAFESIATAKANAEQNLKNARALFESYLNEVFTKRGEGWEEKKLGDLATFRNGINFTKSSKGDSIKIVGVKDFQNNFFAPVDDLDTVTIDNKLPDSDVLKENDILFVRSNGNLQLIGRCMLVGAITEKMTHSGFAIRARLNDESLLPKYICHFLKSNAARQKMIDGGNGTNIKSLNQTTLSDMVIPIPSISEQAQIVYQIENLTEETQRLEALYSRKIAALDELKKALLHRAFSGEL